MRKILVVIDMQNDFIDGALPAEGGKEIVPLIKKRIEYVKDKYLKKTIMFTQDTHFEDTYLDTQEGKKLPVKHCLFGTEGWKICSELDKYADYIFEKENFGSTELCANIRRIYDLENGDIEIELCGVCTDICVITNALLLKTILPEVKIKICSDLCAGTDREAHEAALKVMRRCQIEVL